MTEDLSQGSVAEAPCLLFLHQQKCNGTVGDPAGVADGDRSVLPVEVGFQFCEGFHRLPIPGTDILVDDSAKRWRHRDGGDLPGVELPGFDGALMASEGITVLLLASDPELPGESLCGDPHQFTAERIREPLEERDAGLQIGEPKTAKRRDLLPDIACTGKRSELLAEGEREEQRIAAHRFGTGCDDDGGAAGTDPFGGLGECFEATGTVPGDGVSGEVLGKAGAKRDHSCWIGTAGGLADASEDQFIDSLRIEGGPLEEFPHCTAPEIADGDILELPPGLGEGSADSIDYDY